MESRPSFVACTRPFWETLCRGDAPCLRHLRASKRTPGCGSAASGGVKRLVQPALPANQGPDSQQPARWRMASPARPSPRNGLAARFKGQPGHRSQSRSDELAAETSSHAPPNRGTFRRHHADEEQVQYRFLRLDGRPWSGVPRGSMRAVLDCRRLQGPRRGAGPCNSGRRQSVVEGVACCRTTGRPIP